MIYDMEYTKEDLGKQMVKSKLVLIIYAPEACKDKKVKARVLF